MESVGCVRAHAAAGRGARRFQQRQDPIFSAPDSGSVAVVFRIVAGIVLGAIVLWLVALIFNSCRSFRSMSVPFAFIFVLTVVSVLVGAVGMFMNAYTATPVSAGVTDRACELHAARVDHRMLPLRTRA